MEFVDLKDKVYCPASNSSGTTTSSIRVHLNAGSPIVRCQHFPFPPIYLCVLVCLEKLFIISRVLKLSPISILYFKVPGLTWFSP